MNVSDPTLAATADGSFAVQSRLIARRGVVVTRVSGRAAIALTVASGLLYATGFPPLSWAIAPWFALAPLLVACASVSPLRAALIGLAWAATAATAVAWFLPGMLSQYFGLNPVLCWLATVLVVGALHGIFIGAYTAWVAWLTRRRAAHPLLLAAGWMACEFARAHCGVSSSWALTAYSQVRWLPVIQIADLAGPYGIGLLIAAVNACLAAALLPALRGRRPRLAAATVAAALLATGVYGHWRLAQHFTDGPARPVAIVQGGATPAQKSDRPLRLARYLALTANDADADGGLIVWPEYATEAYLEEASPTREAIVAAADARRADLILGGPHYEAAPGGTRYHNSAYLVRDGKVVARYDKHRLVPFAEDGRLAWLRGPSGKPLYDVGEGSFILPASGLRVATLLCVEAMYAELARAAVNEGGEVLVVLSNDGWFGRLEAARQQLDIATLRAVEMRRYLVRAAATGFSAIIDPHGRTVIESGFDTHEVLNASVRASHVRSPYQRWGDALAWLVIAGVVVASLRALLDQRNTTPQEDQ